MKPAVRQLLFGSAFTPERLFRGGEQGFYFDPSDPSTAYQDSAGTTAGVVGQPLGRRVDKSGRGNNATQGTSASRPVWAQDGSGYFRDTFDAFDDFLTTSAGVAQQMFYCAALHVAGGAGTSRRIFANFESATFKGYGLSIHTTNQLRLVAGNGVAFVGCLSVQTLDVDGKYVVTAWHDGANLNVQINQGSVVQAAFGAVTATGLTTLTEGRDNEAAVNLFNGSFYARVYRAGPPPSAAQIAQIQRFIALRAGVAL